MGTILKDYYRILDEGLSPLDIYICDQVLSDGLAVVTTSKQIEELVETIKESYCGDSYFRGIDYHIKKIIENDGDTDDEYGE